MRLKDLYRTEIYDERRGTSFSPIVLLAVTLVYTVAVVSFDRYQTFRMLPLAAYPIFMDHLRAYPVGIFSGRY